MTAAEDVFDIPVSCVAEADGMWISVSDLARVKGVEKSSVSRRIKRLEDQGLLESRAGSGGQKLVKLAAYEHATGEATDAIRAANGTRASSAGPQRRGAGLSAQQARRVSYQADLAEIELAERRGKLLVADNVSLAVSEAAGRIATQIERLPLRADELADAVAKGGVHAARRGLETFVEEVMAAIAEEFRPLAGSSTAGKLDWPQSQDRLEHLNAEAAEHWRHFDEQPQSKS